MSEEKKVEVPAKFKDLVEAIEKLSVIELSELVKVLEEKFGVSASAPIAVAAAPAAAAADAGAAKTEFSVELKSGGDQKIQVIKVVRELTGLGLKEAKDIVDGAPKVIKDGVKKEDAENMKKKIEEVGGVVELK